MAYGLNLAHCLFFYVFKLLEKKTEKKDISLDLKII